MKTSLLVVYETLQHITTEKRAVSGISVINCLKRTCLFEPSYNVDRYKWVKLVCWVTELRYLMLVLTVTKSL